MNLVLIISFVFLVCTEARKIRSFNGFQVLSVHSETPEQFEVLRSLYGNGTMDFWTRPKHQGLTDIMVSPVQADQLINLLTTNGMTYSVKIPDVKKLVEEEREENKKAASKQMNWTSYPRWSEIEPFIIGLAQYSIATVSIIGQTFQGRNIYVVKLSTGGAPKKSVLIDANIHAREWIAGATATWILNELTTNTAAYADILKKIDIYIIPYINIDGYEYSHTNDRLWRKTRSPNVGSCCRGTDPNRNFPFHYGEEDTSKDPCSEVYKGTKPFSESETAAMRDFIYGAEASGVKFYAYLTFHSYGLFWLLPWGFTKGVYPPDFSEQLDVGTRAINAVQAVHQTEYTVGQTADVLSGAGGCSDDWAKNHGVKYTVTVEMRDTDTGKFGFLLPPSQIIPNAQEVWAGVLVYFNQVISE